MLLFCAPVRSDPPGDPRGDPSLLWLFLCLIVELLCAVAWKGCDGDKGCKSRDNGETATAVTVSTAGITVAVLDVVELGISLAACCKDTTIGLISMYELAEGGTTSGLSVNKGGPFSSVPPR